MSRASPAQSKVSIEPCSEYDQVENALSRLLEPMGEWCENGDRVLVKVNLLRGADPKEAVTTHPEVVRAVVKKLKEQGAFPTIGDSPGFESVQRAAKNAGIEAVASEEGVSLIELGEARRYQHDGWLRSLELSGRIEEFDRIVNMPKLKTHVLTGLTGAVKNLFGCVPGKKKGKLHVKMPQERDFARMLLDIYTHLRPSLNIMDAVMGMDGQGPSSGDPRHVGYLLASRDALALDVIAAEMTSLRVTMLQEARSRQLPAAVRDNIQVYGTIPQLRFRPARSSSVSWLSSLTPLLRWLLSSRPRIRTRQCNRCHRCIEACPKACIRAGRRAPVIDYSRCIRCYCCQELCPQHAIVKRFF